MKYNIQVEVDLEEMEGEIGHVYVLENAIQAAMDNLSHMGIQVISIEEVKSEE